MAVGSVIELAFRVAAGELKVTRHHRVSGNGFEIRVLSEAFFSILKSENVKPAFFDSKYLIGSFCFKAFVLSFGKLS